MAFLSSVIRIWNFQNRNNRFTPCIKRIFPTFFALKCKNQVLCASRDSFIKLSDLSPVSNEIHSWYIAAFSLRKVVFCSSFCSNAFVSDNTPHILSAAQIKLSRFPMYRLYASKNFSWISSSVTCLVLQGFLLEAL